MSDLSNLKEPIDLIKNCLKKKILIKCRHDRTIIGTLHGFDAHLNMILSDVEESYPEDELEHSVTSNRVLKYITRKIPLLYMRGDAILFVSTYDN